MKDPHRRRTGRLLAVFLVAGLCLGARSESPVLSEQAMTSIPDVVRRMQSADPKVRSELIDELVIDEREGDVLRTSLRYALTERDYSIILGSALRGLAKHLPDDDQRRLLARVRYICRTHRPTTIDRAISEFAESPSANVSNTAVGILVDLKSPLATPHLIPELSDPNKYYRAIQGLVSINGTAAIPHIEELLSARNSKMQYWAAWGLFNLGASQCAGDIYSSCVQNRRWRDVDPYFLAVLTKWEDSRVFPVVMKWLTDNDGANRDMIMSRLDDVQAIPIEDSVIALLENGHVEAPDRGTERSIKADAIRLLGMLKSKKAVPLLRKTVGTKDDYLGPMAAAQLGRMEAKEAIPELLSMFDTGRYSDYVAATLALAQIGDPSTIERVLIELKKRPPSAHEVEVLETLGKAAAPQTYQVLRDTSLPKLLSLPANQYFAQIGEKTEITVQLSQSIPEKDKNRLVAARVENTGLSALRRGLATLNYDGYQYVLFIDKDVVHVVTVDEAYSRWDIRLREHWPQ